MKVIILAAGMGTRLEELTKNNPKCLVQINNQSILENQIEILKKNGLENIMVVIGNEGDCWTEENQKKIKEINKEVIINKKNKTTNNSYSLMLALNEMEEEDLLIIDGDLAFSEKLLRTIISVDRDLILTKKSEDRDNPNNKVITEENGKVLEINRKIQNINSEKSVFVYGGVLKVKKEKFFLIKELANKEEYSKIDLGPVINELCKKTEVYNLPEEEWVNVNTKGDLKEAEKLFKKNFLVMMFGYTGTGKSTIAKRIYKIPNTNIFHSAVIRSDLNLSPKTKEEADKFFDYKNNLRKTTDEKVYKELSEYAKKSLENKKNVILDAGFFFEWQRDLIYTAINNLHPEIFIVKVMCDDEEEIKRRLNFRAEKFSESPLNETPSWNAYLSTKLITESLENDIKKGKEVNIIEYDTLKDELKLIKGNENSENRKKIIEAIKNL